MTKPRESETIEFKEVRRLVTSSVKETWDGQLCRSASIADIDLEKVDRFMRVVREARRRKLGGGPNDLLRKAKSRCGQSGAGVREWFTNLRRDLPSFSET